MAAEREAHEAHLAMIRAKKAQYTEAVSLIRDGDERFEKVATWMVPIGKTMHDVKLVHKMINNVFIFYVDEKEYIKKMFCGFTEHRRDQIQVGDQLCYVKIDLFDGDWVYSMEINGEPLKVYKEKYFKIHDTWQPDIYGIEYKIVFDKKTKEVFVDGAKVKSEKKFSGTISQFWLNGCQCKIIYNEKGINVLYKGDVFVKSCNILRQEPQKFNYTQCRELVGEMFGRPRPQRPNPEDDD